MTEMDYLTMETLTRVRDAEAILRAITPGYGITEEERSSIIGNLTIVRDRIMQTINLAQEGEADALTSVV